ncbi:MAG: 2-polyprenyl-3-methyl-6-methoxy-1,4-benzoquinone monooxygenase [Gammaproteobacteria bacterium]|nr:2-polyprenyl-3-methyl-6-methoxy-1,4-benzoquinone monooxygenase [Gammaproteobacteria bacterium]
MQKLSPIDAFITEVQHGLNTCFTKPSSNRTYPATNSSQRNKLTPEEKKHSAGLMRINNAGEVAAQGLYRGQALTAKTEAVYNNMLHASAEENEHLNWCQSRLEELNAQRSLLDPIWYIGSLKIGIIAGLFGDKWSLGFVKETETQVTKHLEEHLNHLPKDDQRSKSILEQMKVDEQQHADAAQHAGAAPLPRTIQTSMSFVSKIMTRSSYYI